MYKPGEINNFSAFFRNKGNLLLLLVASIGIFARFKGFMGLPLAIDEYYLVQSTQNTLLNGVPEFPCGGYYMRGVLLQYVSIPFIQFGMNADSAIRLVTKWN